jgi:nucleotidyltransferase/DNA polymerase involved in DNA repair
MQTETRKLKDLISIGPAMLEDLGLLGIQTVAQLRRRSPHKMYRELCRLKRQQLDLCCLMFSWRRLRKRRTQVCRSSSVSGGTGAKCAKPGLL